MSEILNEFHKGAKSVYVSKNKQEQASTRLRKGTGIDVACIAKNALGNKA